MKQKQKKQANEGRTWNDMQSIQQENKQMKGLDGEQDRWWMQWKGN